MITTKNALMNFSTTFVGMWHVEKRYLWSTQRVSCNGPSFHFFHSPLGAAELARNLLIDADSGLPTAALSCQLGAVIARALRLPEAFKVYEAFMGCLGKDRLDALGLSISFHSLGGPSAVCSVIPDAISYASETGNYASALQWSDQGCSRIWNWLFHSRLSIGQSATEPAVARTLKARPPWIDSWGKRQRGEQNGYDPMADNKVYLSASGYNRVPGFERFLLPKTLAEITSLAEVLGGPIVYLNADRYSSQALAVLPGLDDVVHIPLPDLDDIPFLRAISVEFMKSPQNFLWEGSLMKGLWERKGFKVDPPTYQHTPSIGTRAVHLLAYLWGKIVKPVLDGLGIQVRYSADISSTLLSLLLSMHRKQQPICPESGGVLQVP
ncbi:hypothetical protein BDN72DRAFT_62716 [Pluteus cervinus]|uniref:Uncharacterized protein n=1 Tax=Pluteus cervinus TaxID=181527 RepID=A0ACD2ZYU8_9AGAR|nr:hypothetical protein BDN72DRAFT_62716 [Pluteus cervinus]